MFASLKCDELDAFIMAQQDKEKAEFTAKNKIPKKGTLTEALVGARNKILIAFECRLIKNSIGDILPYDTDITRDASMEYHLRVFTVSLGEGNSVLPSKLLSDERGSDLWFCCSTWKT